MTEATNILAIETSCDETAAAVVSGGREVLSSVVASQVDLHARYGGVVPEVASRAHLESINAIIQKAMSDSGLKPKDISAVAVTREPGLVGSLLVGMMAAKTLAWVWRVPLIGVNHVYAHAYSAALDAEAIEYSAVALICSGGHTALYKCDSPVEMELLGATIDDAAGEAFDKVAGILKLGFPGGPAIERAARDGEARAVDFPRPLLGGNSLDFSFSGLKTAVLYHVNGVPGAHRKKANSPRPVGIENFTQKQVADAAAGFQAAVVDVLACKLRRAAELVRPRSLIIGGGVSANEALRTAAGKIAEKTGCALRLPQMRFTIDNAAMVAGLAWHHLRAGKTDTLDIEVTPTVRR